MEKIINNLKENKWIHYFIIFVIGIILSIPLLKIQITSTHDGILHFLRLVGTVDTLKIGQFPPLINQNYCNSAGYGINLFYAPLVTYVPLLLKIFNFSYFDILKIYSGICIILSGITMYHCTYQITKKRIIALFAAIFYMVAPYKLANIYKRYAMGEFTAAIFIPYVFMGLYNLVEQDGKKHYFISIGAIGLMLSHTVTTFYIAIFSLIYLLLNVKKVLNKKIIIKCIINVIFIVLISMFFYLPLMEASNSTEYTITNSDKMMTNGESASESTISFLEFFKFNDKRDKGWEVTALIGIPVIVLLILSPCIIKDIEKEYKSYYLINIIFAIISLFMATIFFPWKIMPDFLCKLQFPWRMIGFATFFISFVCAINIYNILKLKAFKKENYKIIFTIIIILFMVFESIFYMSRFFVEDTKQDSTYENKILSNPKISHMQINRDYMPMKALVLQKTYVKNREDKTYILNGNIIIEEENKVDLKDIVKVKNGKIGDILEFPYYYYVGYEIVIEKDNNKQIYKPIESKNGYLSYELKEDIQDGTITVEYRGTILQKVSYIISLISLIIYVVYIIYEMKKNGEEDVKKNTK